MSRPTALPTRECLVGYAVKTSPIRFSPFGACRSRACRTAIPATRAARSASATYTGTPSGPSSLNENGTVTSRPSNSGIATCIAASIGDSAASESSHAARADVRHSPWSTGTSSSASAPTSHASSSPPHGGAARPRTAGGEHGGDERVRAPQQLEQPGLRAAQRTAVHGQGVGAVRLDGLAEGVDEGGVPGEFVGAVEEHADGGPVVLQPVRTMHSVRGHLPRRGEALAGEQHGVRQKPAQLGEVRGPALHEIPQRLGDHPGGHGRLGHQLGVRHGLPAEQHGGRPGGPEGCEPVLPGALAAEEPDDDEVGAVEERWQVLGAGAGGVGDPEVRAGGAGGEEIGVGGGEEEDGGHA